MNDEADKLRSELDALENEIAAIAAKRLPKAFGVAVPLMRLLHILRSMNERVEALEGRAGKPVHRGEDIAPGKE